nr:MAG TPA: hypothetical protein [Caudoviricetes sp.]
MFLISLIFTSYIFGEPTLALSLLIQLVRATQSLVGYE